MDHRKDDKNKTQMPPQAKHVATVSRPALEAGESPYRIAGFLPEKATASHAPAHASTPHKPTMTGTLRSMAGKPLFAAVCAGMLAFCLLVTFGLAQGHLFEPSASQSEGNDTKGLDATHDVGTLQADTDAADYVLASQDIAQVTASSGSIEPFCPSGAAAPVLGESDLSLIQAALASIEDTADVGLVFIDVDSGRGIAYNADTIVYGASSIKGPFATYVCELAESGTITLDDQCPLAYANGISNFPGYGFYPTSDLIEASVTSSDNSAFGSLREAYDSQGWDDWSSSLGAADVASRADSWFPWYCARSSAVLWAETYRYLETGSETAAWLAGLYENVETSFIRDGLAQIDCTTYTKAGWCADYDPAYNSLCDAGIIKRGGHTYIMSIMTGLPDSEENRARVSTLAGALFAARASLA